MSTYAEDMTVVQVSTELVPAVGEEIARRRLEGWDTHDEWWEGVYRIVTGPSPEHGRLLGKLVVLLDPLVEAASLYHSEPANIGIDKEDCRVPDMGVYAPDTPRTSPAFLQTAVLAVEILSPGERPGEKMPFYLAWDVNEYLEIDLVRCTARLYRQDGQRWSAVAYSKVLPDMEVFECGVRTPAGSLDIHDFQPD